MTTSEDAEKLVGALKLKADLWREAEHMTENPETKEDCEQHALLLGEAAATILDLSKEVERLHDDKEIAQWVDYRATMSGRVEQLEALVTALREALETVQHTFCHECEAADIAEAALSTKPMEATDDTAE